MISRIDRITIMREQFECRSHSATMLDGRFSYPGSTPHYAPDRIFDTQHMRLVASLDFVRKTLKGRCVVTLKAIADQATELVF